MADEVAPRIRRGRRNAGYTAISNTLIDHPTLSPEARLVLIYLLSKPDDWQLQPGDIRRLLGTSGSLCGRNKAYEVIKELKTSGHVVAIKEVARSGHFAGVTYYVFDEPPADAGAFKGASCACERLPADDSDNDATDHTTGAAAPRPENRDTVAAPNPLFRDPVKRDLTKNGKTQTTESPSPPPRHRPSVSSKVGEDGGSDFSTLWRDWPTAARPRERRLAERIFARLAADDQRDAIDFASRFRGTQGRLGRFPAMIPYLRDRVFSEFVDAPEHAGDGYFRITPERPEWSAWMADLESRVSAERCARQRDAGFLLVRTRWPEATHRPLDGAGSIVRRERFDRKALAEVLPHAEAAQ